MLSSSQPLLVPYYTDSAYRRFASGSEKLQTNIPSRDNSEGHDTTRVNKMASSEPKPALGSDRKRSSIIKGSFQSDSALYGKTGVKQILTAPSQSHSRMTPGGQTFLCIMGSVISIAISIWLAAFSREPGWRRAVFATGAALCAVMFAFLAFMTIRRAKHPPEPEALPDLSQRRSTIGARVSKKSIATAGLTSGGGDDCPTQVLVVGDKKHPALTVG